MNREKINQKLSTLPLQPGCYLMKNKAGKIIYIGKAKKLKNRVSSYFTGAHDTKTSKMVSLVDDFDIIITSTEREALILEINLIKKYKPRYNILFMDDKSYPYIKLNKTSLPFLRVVREKKHSKDSYYYGPYPDATAAHQAVKILNEIFPTRKCFPLKKEKCLYFHLGQCLAPCEEEMDEEVVTKMRNNIRDILSGNIGEVTSMLTEQMHQQANNLEFEKAQTTKTQIEALKYITSKQSVQTSDKSDFDVFNYVVDKGYLCGVGLFFRKGQMLQKNMILQPIMVDEHEAMTSFIVEYYQNNPVPGLVVIPKDMDADLLSETLDTTARTFVRGQKRKLLEMAKKNASQQIHARFEKLKAQDDIKTISTKTLSEMLDTDIQRIEVIDVSHTSGSDSVGACVVFEHGVPDKKSYRKYKLHQNNNDVASLQEMVYRRYLRILKQEEKASDVLIVDGGKNQVHGVKQTLESLDFEIPVIGLVKDEHHNTSGIYLLNGQTIELDKRSELYLMLAFMQDEVHRFAISYHRQRRLKSMTRSILDDIKGVGPKRKQQLMKHFGSLKKIKEASLDELILVLGEKTGELVYNQLHGGQTDED